MTAGARITANEGGSSGLSPADRIAQGRQLRCNGRHSRNRQHGEQDWVPRKATATGLALARIGAFSIRRCGERFPTYAFLSGGPPEGRHGVTLRERMRSLRLGTDQALHPARARPQAFLSLTLSSSNTWIFREQVSRPICSEYSAVRLFMSARIASSPVSSIAIRLDGAPCYHDTAEDNCFKSTTIALRRMTDLLDSYRSDVGQISMRGRVSTKCSTKVQLQGCKDVLRVSLFDGV